MPRHPPFKVHGASAGRTILEYWIPVEDLDELNANIVGSIALVAEFRRRLTAMPPLGIRWPAAWGGKAN